VSPARVTEKPGISSFSPRKTEVLVKVGQYQNCLGTVYESSHIASFGFKPKPLRP